MRTYADKTQENKAQSATNAVFQKLSSGKATFQLDDNRPENIAQRKLQQIANNSLKVKQWKAFKGVDGSVAQLVNIRVGFDCTPTQSMFAGPADTLTTTGLGNCIAIVAYHAGVPSLGAVMRHYDTINACIGSAPDARSGEHAFTFDAARIGAVAANTAAQLVAQVPAAAGNIRFAVALGIVWSNVDPKTAKWQSRLNLYNAIVAGVGANPSIAGSTANFDVATGVLST